MTIPFDYHRFIIGAKGGTVRRLMEQCEANITIPPPRDESDVVTIVGSRAKVQRAVEMLKQKVAEIEAENEDRVSGSANVTIPPLSLYGRFYTKKSCSGGSVGCAAATRWGQSSVLKVANLRA